MQARARADTHAQAMQAAAEDARAGLRGAQQERVALLAQQACLRQDLKRLHGDREAAEQVLSQPRVLPAPACEQQPARISPGACRVKRRAECQVLWAHAQVGS